MLLILRGQQKKQTKKRFLWVMYLKYWAQLRVIDVLFYKWWFRWVNTCVWSSMDGYELWGSYFFTLVHRLFVWYRGFVVLFFFFFLSPITFLVTRLTDWNLAYSAIIQVIWETLCFDSQYSVQHPLHMTFRSGLVKGPLPFMGCLMEEMKSKSVS